MVVYNIVISCFAVSFKERWQVWVNKGIQFALQALSGYNTGDEVLAMVIVNVVVW